MASRSHFTGEVSVIVPSHGRAKIVAELLQRLKAQSLDPNRYEVLLVDDGSRPALAALLPASLQKSARILRIKSRRGPAAARNVALAKAGGRIVLFLNSDAVPSTTMLEAHLNAHRNGNGTAVLGRFDTHPSCADLFLRLCDFEGLVFPYHMLKPGTIMPGNFFWTCNVSVLRSLVMRAGGFDGSFPFPMQDDVDLGYRLWKRGTGVVFHPEIECFHNHPMSYWQLIERYRLMGHEWVRFTRKHGAAVSLELLGRPFEPDNNLGRDILAHLDRLERERPDPAHQFLLEFKELQSDETRFFEKASGMTKLLRDIVQREWLRGAVAAIAGVPALLAAGIDSAENKKPARMLAKSERRRLLSRAPCWNTRAEQLLDRTGYPLDDCILQNRPELEAFCDWIARNRIRSFLEIGSWTGRLPSLLARMFGFNKTAACDQLWAYRTGLPMQFSPRVEVFIGSSHSREFQQWRSKLGHIDLVFIDGDHNYECIRKDFEIQKQYSHRFIAFHDITGGYPSTEGVAKFWRGLRGGNRTEICFPDPSLHEGVSRMGIGIWSK